MTIQNWTYVFVILTFGIYLVIAWLARVRETKGFYVAGRGVPSYANGMATAADWMSAASFISMAGLVATMGYSGGAYLMGWTGGYVLLALLFAPYLRKFGHYTVPDFVGDRFDSRAARLVAIACAIFISFTYVAGQMRGVGVVFSRFLEVNVDVGVLIGMGIVFLYATLGGMKGITWTQVAQYWVLITAFLIPAIAISLKLTGNPLPSLGLGSQLTEGGAFLLDKLDQLNADLGFTEYTSTFVGKWDMANVFCLALVLMAGTAGLPHVIVRFYTVKSVKAARWSGFWALLFIAMLYLTAPAVAGFARYYMLTSLNGKTQEELPNWYGNWSKTGLIHWFDDGDGKVVYNNQDAENEIFRRGTIGDGDWETLLVRHQEWLSTGGARGEDARPFLIKEGLKHPDKDIIVLATPEMAELADWIVAFIAAGALAAALSTASGLLLVISSSVAHDLYYRLLKPSASEAERLLVGRAVIGVAVIIAGYLGINPPGFVGEVVAFAFGLAAASFFPAILLGIFTKRVSTIPAVSGMLAGIGFTAFYIIACKYGGMAPWTFGVSENGILPQGIGVVGMLVNFAVTFALTPFFPPPRQEVQDLVDSVREPEGVGPALDIETAPEH